MRKGKFSKQVITRELWSKFIVDFPEYKDLTWDEFRVCWDDVADTIRTESITNPLGVKLGRLTGELKFQYLPHKFKAVDHNVTEELGEEIKHLNINTKGKVGSINWIRRWAVKFNKRLQFWTFQEDRKMNVLAKKYATEFPEKLRVARNTLGGFSVWRQYKKEK